MDCNYKYLYIHEYFFSRTYQIVLKVQLNDMKIVYHKMNIKVVAQLMGMVQFIHISSIMGIIFSYSTHTYQVRHRAPVKCNIK